MAADDWLMEKSIEQQAEIERIQALLDALPASASPKQRENLEKDLKKARSSSPYFSPEISWDAIKTSYQRFVNDAIDSFPGHVLALAPAERVRTDGFAADDAETQAEWGTVGMKPVGEKRLGHHFHTCLFAYVAGGAWKMTTARKTTGPATERGDVKGETVADFVASFLIPYAGWVID